jgi:gamma-glutamyltranspeptidase/glutathione hydrolase
VFEPARGVPADRTVYGANGACATSHPLAAGAGLHVLREGGSAADAAVAMAAALTVVEPTSNGIGSDAFALVWAEGKLHGLNGSGRAPALLDAEAVRSAGHRDMPARGWLPVTVPGAPAAWRDVHERFGRLDFEDVLRPAVDLAYRGAPVPPVVSYFWRRSAEIYAAWKGPEFAAWPETFTREGRAPETGERVRLPHHARTLARIARSGAADFYDGRLAREIDRFSRETGGLLRAEDLAAHRSAWVKPLRAAYRGVELWEIPPNGQGIVALAALRVLGGLDAGESWADPDGVHASIEAVKLAFADARVHVGDPDHMRVAFEAFLEEGYAASRRSLIGTRAEARTTGLPRDHGTVYLAAADRDGMMVSWIQSNYMGFGSGVVVPGTGIALQNRGAGFSLEPGHVNEAAGGKRPFHTIIPGFLTRGGEPWGPVGVMGGHMQPQGHVQVVRALVDFGLPPQSALDLPRWIWKEGLRVEAESAWPRETTDALRARGHDLTRTPDPSAFGRGQIILRDGDGVYAAGSDRRADGRPLAW